MKEDLLEEVAENMGKERDEISAIIDEFVLQLHRRLYEYKGLNGDYFGEELHWQIGKQAFCHLLYFLDCFSERYEWEPGSALEYLLRLGTRADWMPYQHQTEAWKEKSESQNRKVITRKTD